VGNIGFDYCDDIQVIKNIVVAIQDRPLDFRETSHADKSSNILRVNNLYFGGIRPNIKGYVDVADPFFVNPGLDTMVADFRVKVGSPAVNTGCMSFENLPVIDLLSNPRNIMNGKTDRGAVKFE
jgi:hypothetical protein